MSGQKWNRGMAVVVFAAAAMLVLPQCSFAQPAGIQITPKDGSAKLPNGTDPPIKGQPAVPAEVVFELVNARATMKSFLAAAEAGDHAKAARAIDFKSMAEPPEDAERANLAFKLAEVIKSLPNIEIGLISDDPEGENVLRSEEHTSELQSRRNLVCHLLLEKKNTHLNPAPPRKT